MKTDVAVQGTIFNIQRYSIQDGPGVRTTVFFKGCPLRCWWCSNPESQASFTELGLARQLCTLCARCVTACPSGAITLKGEELRIARGRCNGCGACIEVCYPQALKLWGEDMPVSAVLEKAKRDGLFYRNSEGGVTLSGGEPLSQPEFALSFLRLCQDAGLHTCIETCGFCDPRVIKEVAGDVDLFLYDLKHMNTAAHKEHTGVPNERILANARLIAAAGGRMIIRLPLIPGINDSMENISATCRFVRDLGSVDQIDLLPYHRFGMNKYEMLGRRYPLGNLAPGNSEAVERARSIVVDEFNFKCQVGG